jgi:hypothetical protein
LADLRALIVERLRQRQAIAPDHHHVLDIYNYLLHCGADPDDAVNAMFAYVDEVIASRKRPKPKLYVVKNEQPVGE